MSKLGKKLLALLLAGTMTFSLAACGNDSPVPSYEYAGCISGNACGVSLSGYSGAGHDGLCPKLTGT